MFHLRISFSNGNHTVCLACSVLYLRDANTHCRGVAEGFNCRASRLGVIKAYNNYQSIM